MIYFKSILIILIISFFSLGCTQPPVQVNTPIPAPSPKINVTELKVSFNKEFTLSLEANPSTGYSWVAKFDESFLKLENKTFVPYPHPTQIIGAGGKENFTFIPLKTGETDIVMQYKRAWEKDVLEEKTFWIIITE